MRIRQSVGSASGDRLAPRPRATPVKPPPKEEEAAVAAVGGEGASEEGGGLVDGLRNVKLGDAAAEVNGCACALSLCAPCAVGSVWMAPCATGRRPHPYTPHIRRF